MADSSRDHLQFCIPILVRVSKGVPRFREISFRGFDGNLGIMKRFCKMAISWDFYVGIRDKRVMSREISFSALSDGCGKIKFPTLGCFVKSFLSLPHSNERIFSSDYSYQN